jgi:hypothetical protein
MNDLVFVMLLFLNSNINPDLNSNSSVNEQTAVIREQNVAFLLRRFGYLIRNFKMEMRPHFQDVTKV